MEVDHLRAKGRLDDAAIDRLRRELAGAREEVRRLDALARLQPQELVALARENAELRVLCAAYLEAFSEIGV